RPHPAFSATPGGGNQESPRHLDIGTRGTRHYRRQCLGRPQGRVPIPLFIRYCWLCDHHEHNGHLAVYKEPFMITRRDYLKLSIAAGSALAVNPKLLLADDSGRALIRRAIPGTTEQLPVVGLGSSASFSRIASEGK